MAIGAAARYEDERLAEARFISFVEKRDRKLLASDWSRKKMETCLEKVPLSSSEDGLVRFGSVVQLESAEVGGTLACDPFEEISLGSRAYLATVRPNPSSSPQLPSPARAVFKVVAVTDPRQKDLVTQARMRKEGRDALSHAEGEKVRFGDVFHLECDRGLRVCEAMNMLRPPLYLASGLKTQSLSSRISNQQAVFLKLGASSGTVWQFQKPKHGKYGGLDRLMSVGQPVSADTELVLVHRDTLMALSCQRTNVESTDFGAEFEVSCANITTNGRCLQLDGEQRGTKTAGVAARAELGANRWLVRQMAGNNKVVGGEETGTDDGNIGGGDASVRGRRARELPRDEMTADSLLEKARRVRSIAQSRGPACIHRLRHALRSMDPAVDGRGGDKVDREDVRWCLNDIGVALDDEQSQILFDKFDRGASGLIKMEEFLGGLRGALSDRRRKVVEAAFRSFDLDDLGKVSMQQLKGSFDATAAGRALSDGDNTITPVETLDAMRLGLVMMCGDSKSGDALTLADFERFHQDLCVNAEDDDLFEGTIKAAWQGSKK